MNDHPKDQPVTAIHLDAVGGIAGDMFVAALLHARPDLWPLCQRALAALDLGDGVTSELVDHLGGGLAGKRFRVEETSPAGNGGDHHHGHHGGHHVTWREIRRRLESAPLEPRAQEVAIAIFARLAAAEAAVHGRDVDDVTFHEVGAVDSLVDIVCAGVIIAALSPCRWSVGALPRGSGQVKTAHGILPVPAPATLELLKGHVLIDDGEAGERITPTGAAILCHLGASQATDPTPRRLVAVGSGFGTRKLQGRPNMLRASLMGPVESPAGTDHVAVLRCEIDDQTAEDLAAALDHLRAADGVIDVCQWPVFGKKGRMGTAIQVLAEPARADMVASRILDETTTLGVRRSTQERALLDRRQVTADGLPVKIAQRPSGPTAKAEMDALAGTQGLTNRAAHRHRAERAALTEDGSNDR